MVDKIEPTLIFLVITEQSSQVQMAGIQPGFVVCAFKDLTLMKKARIGQQKVKN